MNTQATYLQEVSDHRYLGKLLMRFGIESGITGLLLGPLAIPTLVRGGPPMAVVWLLIIALVGHGLFVIVKPYPKGLIVDCILKSCIACLLIVASWPHSHFVLVRAWLVPWWTIGLSQFASALVSTARYIRVRHVHGAVAVEWLNYVDGLVAAVKAAAAAHDPTVIEVIRRSPTGTEKFKAQLYQELAVFVGPRDREVLIADRSDFILGPAQKSPVKGRVAAQLSFGSSKVKVLATSDAYSKLSDWSTRAVATVRAETSPAVV
jgi:hypothetical protein